MAPEAVQHVPEVEVEGFIFSSTIKPLNSSTNIFFLGGAGARGVQIQDKFINVTAIGVYLEQKAITSLSLKWKGKTADELMDSVEFFRDIVTGPFDKFMKITMILPLTGQQYSEKVAEKCAEIWNTMGFYTEAEGKALEKFNQVFKDETFTPGSSILFTVSSPNLTIGFSKDGSMPQEGKTTIENKLLSESVLESMIGKNGVSPAARRSLAVRISELMKIEDGETAQNITGGSLQLKVEDGEAAKYIKEGALLKMEDW